MVPDRNHGRIRRLSPTLGPPRRLPKSRRTVPRGRVSMEVCRGLSCVRLPRGQSGSGWEYARSGRLPLCGRLSLFVHPQSPLVLALSYPFDRSRTFCKVLRWIEWVSDSRSSCCFFVLKQRTKIKRRKLRGGKMEVPSRRKSVTRTLESLWVSGWNRSHKRTHLTLSERVWNTSLPLPLFSFTLTDPRGPTPRTLSCMTLRYETSDVPESTSVKSF